MRPHGHARVNARHPEALGICYRCGFMWNRNDLAWQYDWQFSARLHNIGTLVCPDCLDLPQPSGRPITLPPDPIAIEMPSPEYLAQADNPVSTLLFNPAASFLPQPPQTGTIGNMTLNAGVNAAFDGNPYKRAQFSAALAISNASFNNTLGKNWNGFPSGVTQPLLPTTVLLSLAPGWSTAPTISHILANVTLTAPNDARFLNTATGITGVNVDGSNGGLVWTTLLSTTTRGTVGETLTATVTSTTAYGYHRVAFQGDGFSGVSVAQVQFSVSDSYPNDI